ncbi:MAG: cupin domain-containing protein [Nesterenkonia sp.]
MSEDPSTTTPQVLVNPEELLAEAADDAAGAVWKLQQHQRDLDSNVIALPAGGTIAEHQGPDVDVLIHVLAGTGTLHTAGEDIALEPGALIWMPKGSRRGFTAGPAGLRHFTVHQKRQALTLQPPRASQQRGQRI